MEEARSDGIALLERPAPEQKLGSTKESPNLKTGLKSSSEPDESQTREQSLEGLRKCSEEQQFCGLFWRREVGRGREIPRGEIEAGRRPCGASRGWVERKTQTRIGFAPEGAGHTELSAGCG